MKLESPTGLIVAAIVWILGVLAVQIQHARTSALLRGRTVRLVDTAGLEEAAPETLAGRMRAGSAAAVDQADLVVFVVHVLLGDLLCLLGHLLREPHHRGVGRVQGVARLAGRDARHLLGRVVAGREDLPVHQAAVARPDRRGRCHGGQLVHAQVVAPGAQLRASHREGEAAHVTSLYRGDVILIQCRQRGNILCLCCRGHLLL